MEKENNARIQDLNDLDTIPQPRIHWLFGKLLLLLGASLYLYIWVQILS
jgi:hypothetical protein